VVVFWVLFIAGLVVWFVRERRARRVTGSETEDDRPRSPWLFKP